VRRLLLVPALAALLGAAGPKCSGDAYTGTQTIACPRRDVFTGQPVDGGAPAIGVSVYLERRCGTLDCHGSSLRPMRLYGQHGLRHPAEQNFPGGVGTTLAELDANYGAVCNVEPEKMAQAVSDVGQSADQLLVYRKARNIEGHKGGEVIKEGSSADRCLLGWLRGDAPDSVTSNCEDAISRLE
jgi:hypothetical protein